MDSAVKLVSGTVSVPELLEKYVDVETYLGYCAQCPHYGERWSCPPYDFDPLDVWRSFDRLEITAFRIEPRDEEDKALAGRDPEAYLRPFARELTALLKVWEKSSPGSLRLNPGRCRECYRCARTEGEPCRYPDKLRGSIESLGGAVGALCRDVLDTPLLWPKNGEAPAYLLLVGGLLKKE